MITYQLIFLLQAHDLNNDDTRCCGSMLAVLSCDVLPTAVGWGPCIDPHRHLNAKVCSPSSTSAASTCSLSGSLDVTLLRRYIVLRCCQEFSRW